MNQSGGGEEPLKIIAAKIGALLAIGSVSFFCGVIPYYSIRAFKNRFPTSIAQKITSGFICFSGGTLLGVTFLHLMPEVRERISYLQEKHNVLAFPENLPLSDIIAMSGFFGVYLLDELLHIVFSLDNHENSKHQFSNSRRSNHHAVSAPICICQSKTVANDVTEEKELICIIQETNNSDAKGSGIVLNRAEHASNVHCFSSHAMSPVSGLITIAALSFHDIFEGIAIGIEQDLNSILFLYLSIASHKYAIAFCIGMDLVVAGSRLKMIVLSMMVFSLVSPVGVIIGTVVVAENTLREKYEIDSPASVIMQGIAGGTLIYIVCFEVLQREVTDTHKKGIQNVMFVIFGFLVTLGFKILTGHSHP
ncbi:zinc/iron transporter, putative [Pediculus humanus corporis]|uniref:Zinc/iron transporter, putative n=1 Tax=Pediculus humanus subsp. corporis TaxID=121224 RepID=E0VNA2_PEDHC|nr:zinc/iron transporter, putative [Pediculus humanus corporis]EEB14858.1 zinc/iron transporter, putative [Pediculus humanus corporis]